MNCPACGFESGVGSRFCQRCGAGLGNTPAFATAGFSSGGVATGAAVAAAPLAVPHYGGFWIRVVAAIIDSLLLNIAVMPVALMLGGGLGLAGAAVAMPDQGIEFVAGLTGFALGVLASWLYSALLESSSKQATVGKMVFGLRVTDSGGNRVSFARASGRHFAKYLSGLTLGIGFVMVGFTARKQGLHDMIAETLVVWDRRS